MRTASKLMETIATQIYVVLAKITSCVTGDVARTSIPCNTTADVVSNSCQAWSQNFRDGSSDVAVFAHVDSFLIIVVNPGPIEARGVGNEEKVVVL